MVQTTVLTWGCPIWGPTQHRVGDREGRHDGFKRPAVPPPPTHRPPSAPYHWGGPRPTFSRCTSRERPRRPWSPRPPVANGGGRPATAAPPLTLPVVGTARWRGAAAPRWWRRRAASAGWPKPRGRGVACAPAGGHDATTLRHSAAVRRARAPAIPRPHFTWAASPADDVTALMTVGTTPRPASPHGVRERGGLLSVHNAKRTEATLQAVTAADQPTRRRTYGAGVVFTFCHGRRRRRDTRRAPSRAGVYHVDDSHQQRRGASSRHRPHCAGRVPPLSKDTNLVRAESRRQRHVAPDAGSWRPMQGRGA